MFSPSSVIAMEHLSLYGFALDFNFIFTLIGKQRRIFLRPFIALETMTLQARFYGEGFCSKSNLMKGEFCQRWLRWKMISKRITLRKTRELHVRRCKQPSQQAAKLRLILSISVIASHREKRLRKRSHSDDTNLIYWITKHKFTKLHNLCFLMTSFFCLVQKATIY